MYSEATKQHDSSGGEGGFFSPAGQTAVGAGKNGEEISRHLRQLAQEVFTDISALDPSRRKELLGVFVSELFLSVSEQERREYRRQQQAEGIEAAKQRGVRFGRSRKPLPENFEECRQAWRGGRVTLRQAARACGMSHATFRNAALRVEGSD